MVLQTLCLSAKAAVIVSSVLVSFGLLELLKAESLICSECIEYNTSAEFNDHWLYEMFIDDHSIRKRRWHVNGPISIDWASFRWMDWTKWSDCSRTCGGGQIVRHKQRMCGPTIISIETCKNTKGCQQNFILEHFMNDVFAPKHTMAFVVRLVSPTCALVNQNFFYHI